MLTMLAMVVIILSVVHVWENMIHAKPFPCLDSSCYCTLQEKGSTKLSNIFSVKRKDCREPIRFASKPEVPVTGASEGQK